MGRCGARIGRVLATHALILRTHSEILGVVLVRYKTPPIDICRSQFYSRSLKSP
jgi:hypothetical protein